MSSGEDSGERNPFAPPPPGAPDQPWQPRTPHPDQRRPDGRTDEDHPQPQRGPQPAPKLDPADPSHRAARNALYSGFAALITALFTLYWLAFPLALLAVWYAVTVLRTPAEPVTDPFTPRPVRPQVPAALGALITGGLALVISVSAFTVQIAYRDYLSCLDNAVTQEGSHSCAQDHDAPAWLSDLMSADDKR
ncbi:MULTISPECIES: hypothetical protein [Kitasatospora]|uniref:Integral membrane protein n=1 Tax=Kitasatospora setae (strain ATCC 33774 / DSM 43861 / JCM 3304 / KCC A-0304 / NBRC 14216 / KM-6054) TaxID=452652 RepID=E4NCE1_KITSK|nr:MULTISPECIES: hypothetical protein [Kitasatospora]BAJ28872.1 hypothetical protein KSE_30610 [Kitasatospora setae KM-6054]